MREARIILPYSEMSTQDAARHAIKSIIDHFGGATVQWGNGHWLSPSGTVVEEEIKIVDIAYKPSRDGDMQLFDIAQYYRIAAKQKEVYLRYGNGHVQLVSEKTLHMDNGETADLPVQEFLSMRDAMGVLMDETATLGEKIAAFEYAVHSLDHGSKGNHKAA